MGPHASRLLPVLALGALAAPLPAQGRGELLAEVVDVLQRHFHDPRVRERVRELARPFVPMARAAASAAEERAIVHAFLGTVPASHLALYSAATHRRLQDELASRRAPTFGFQLTELGGRFFVSDVLEGSAAAACGIRRGDRVLAIDDVPPGRSARLDARSDDAALPDPPLHDLLCAADDAIVVALEVRPGVRRSVAVRATSWSAALALDASAREIEQDGRRYGYLHVRYMHFTGVPERVRKALQQRFARCAGVVIDLRGRGGSAATVQALAKAIEGLEHHPPLAFLIDAGTRSAKEAFAEQVRQRRLGILVGERSAGALLPATFAELADGSVLMYPSFALDGVTQRIEGKGVAPDVEASAPLPYAEGRDGILDAALRVLAGRSRA